MARTTELAQLKRSVKEALIELLHEDPTFLREIVEEALEDVGLLRAMKEGRKTKLVPREKLAQLLKGKK
jgi:hypothetical protein